MSSTISRSDAHLGVGQRVGQRLAQSRREVALVLEPDAAPRLAGQRLHPLVQQVDEEQFLERQPVASRHGLGHGLRPVHHPQRIRDACARPATWRIAFGKYSLTCGSSSVEVHRHDVSDDLERQSFGGRVDGEHPPLRRTLVVGAEVHELPRRQLTAVVEAHRARREQQVALVDAAVQKGLPRPRRFDHAAVVLQHRLEDAQPLARGEHALGDHAADHRGVGPRAERRDGRDRARVLVAVRDQPQQVARRLHVQLLECAGAPRAHALEVRDRRVQRDPRIRRRHATRRSTAPARTPQDRTARDPRPLRPPRGT